MVENNDQNKKYVSTASNFISKNAPHIIKFVRSAIRIILVLAIGIAISVGIYLLKPARNTVLLSLLIGAIALGLLGVYPLTYFAYRAFGAEAQRKRLRDDFRLFGLVDDKDLEDTINTLYHNVYSPPQFIIYILLIIIVSVILAVTYIFPDQQEIIPSGSIKLMLFAYLGAYVFSIQELIRRYNTFDLQPQVYSSILIRMLVAIALIFVIATVIGFDNSFFQLDSESSPSEGTTQAWMMIVAFAIGIFPSDGLRWILRQARRILNPPNDQGNELPLKNIVGISTWHESRLAMMGIDNAQNLATVDIPKLLLTTQFDTQQVANWIDQAILYVKVGDHIDRFREAKINTFHEFQRAMDNLTDEKMNDESNNNKNNHTKLESLASVLGLSNVPELNRLREFSNFPNYTHLDNFYEGTGRIGSKRGEESVQKLMGLPVFGVEWSLELLADGNPKKKKENFENEETKIKTKFWGRQKDPTLYKELGNLYLMQESKDCFNKALEQFEKAIQLDNNFVEAYIGRSNANIKLEQFEPAIFDITKVIDLEPSNAKAYNRRGEIYLQAGFYDLAIEDFNKALNLDRSLAVAYNNRGVGYYTQGKVDKAIAQFEYALIAGLDEHFLPGLWYVWGVSLILSNKYSEAIEKLSIAISKNHKLWEAYANRGKAYIELGEAFFDQAKKDLDMAKSIAEEKGEEGKGWALDNDLGMLEFKKGNFKESINHFEKAVNKHNKLTNEEYFWGRVNLAIAYYNIRDLKNAIQQFQVLRTITKNRTLDETEQGRYNYLSGLIRSLEEEFEKLQKVLETNRQFGDKNGEALALVHIADYNKKVGELGKAYNNLKEALVKYTELGAVKEIAEIQQQLNLLKAENN